ncbi:glyoxalase [Escherichia coli]|nr:hypothetical protein EC12741_4783 [Escherichia coli 1.2741]OTB60111.1 glyoxalase [Escherichia coli]OTC22969.1 glyoxalase [Escherichia coli]OTE59426.1 glyoxalase [Escherichia coli]PDV45290.1 glyoxalase [Escherichia coli]
MSHFTLPTALFPQNKSTTVLSEKIDFYSTTLQRDASKNASFLCGISSFHHDVFDER